MQSLLIKSYGRLKRETPVDMRFKVFQGKAADQEYLLIESKIKSVQVTHDFSMKLKYLPRGTSPP